MQDFWNHVNRDPLDYYFFIFDMKQRRERTQIFLALEGGKVEGLMLIYARHIVQLRGSRQAMKALFNQVDLKEVELQTPLDCEDIVLPNYKLWLRNEIVLMQLHKGEENIQIKHTSVKLGVDDVEEIVDLMQKADPKVWGDLDAEQQKAEWEDAVLVGTKHKGKLVSVGLTRFADFASNISAIATDERYRNMGFATSIVSSLVQEILKKSPIALIHVRKDNAPAVRVYSKVGFKRYRDYLLFKGTRII
jgi:ribosomal protein S18 acetylase RimI-like enzyme